MARDPGGIRYDPLGAVAGSVTGEMYQFVASTRAAIYIQTVRPPRQPYALDTPTFAFAALATFAARAQVGGSREVAIAAFVTARMAADVVGDRTLPSDDRRSRAASARRWLSTLAISEPLRRAFGELVGATEEDAHAVGIAVRRVMDVTGAILDAASRQELERLAKELEAQTVGRT